MNTNSRVAPSASEAYLAVFIPLLVLWGVAMWAIASLPNEVFEAWQEESRRR